MKKRFSEAQILGILQQQDAGMKVLDICREHGIAESSFFRWKAKYGGMELSEMKRLKALEDENRRLKRLVADLSLDKTILQDALSKKW